MMKKSGWLSTLAWLLVVIGSLNWGLVGLGGLLGGSNWNVVSLLLGNWGWLESLVYLLVGVAGLLFIFKCHCRKCTVGNMREMHGAPAQQM